MARLVTMEATMNLAAAGISKIEVVLVVAVAAVKMVATVVMTMAVVVTLASIVAMAIAVARMVKMGVAAVVWCSWW